MSFQQMDSARKKSPPLPAHPRETRTNSLPTTVNTISSLMKLGPSPSKYYVKPIGNSVGFLKPLRTQFDSIDIPSSTTLTQRTTSRAYSRQIKISSDRGTSTYSLQRSDDGQLTSFKPVVSEYCLEQNKKTTLKISETPKTPKKKKAIPPPMTVVPGPRSARELNSRSTEEVTGLEGLENTGGFNFFNLVSQALKDKQRKIFEEKELLQNSQGDESPIKGRIKRALKTKKSTVCMEFDLLKPGEREILQEYEREILGTYITSESKEVKRRGFANIIKDRPTSISTKMQKKLQYLKKLKRNIVDEDFRVFLIRFLQARKAVKKSLAEKDLKKVMNELNQVLNLIIDIDDIYLFLEILHLISDTYYDFGEMDNALFAYNQLRMACELCNNISKKIISLTGMAEICKRLGYLNQSLFMLKRALQFAWYVKDTNKECQIYDLLGIIYYTQGEIETANYYHEKCVDSKIEGENSPLRKITRAEIAEYIKSFHSEFTSIEPTFFTKLSIAYRPRWLKTTNSKLTKEKLRNYLHTEGQNEENYFDNEAKLTKASVFIEKLLIKARRHHGASYYSEEPVRELGTFVSALHQLDVIFAEPDFDRNITSPRSFYKKQDQELPIKSSKVIKTEGSESVDSKCSEKLNPRYLVRKVQISDAQYLDLKKDKNKYSLKQIFKERELTFKNVEDRVELCLNKVEDGFAFEDLRKKFKAQYTATPVNTKMFMGHLTPNRTTYGFLSVIEIKASRCNAFFDDALEYFASRKKASHKSNNSEHRKQAFF